MNPLILLDVAGRVAESLTRSPYVPVQKADAPVVKEEVAEVLQKEVAPVIEHLTNNEPWYRSRVTWGAIFAILGGVATIGTMAANGVPLSWETYGTPALSIWGGVQALYGRWKARKPIGA